MDNVYVWYSDATNLTGKTLMDELKCKGGTAKPADKKIDTIICWGTKIAKDIDLKGYKVYNHPNSIRTNRNKPAALSIMKKGGCTVGDVFENFGGAGVTYPCIARTKFHQGGKGFWLCMNKDMLAQAAKEGAEYAQAFLHIKDEYRLHIFEGKVIYAVKKVARENMQEAFVAHQKEKIENWAKNNNVALDNATLEAVLKRVARDEAEKPDYIVRSNTRGWKFSHIAKAPDALVAEATKALKSLGLNYGAVDCCTDINNKAYIIEVNSGPGLDGTTLKTWVDSFKELLTPKPAKGAAVPAQKPVAAAAKEAKNAAPVAAIGAKAAMKQKLELLGQMLDAANDDEAAVLQGLFAKLGK